MSRSIKRITRKARRKKKSGIIYTIGRKINGVLRYQPAA